MIPMFEKRAAAQRDAKVTPALRRNLVTFLTGQKPSWVEVIHNIVDIVDILEMKIN